MATKSVIAMGYRGEIFSVYCANDGYLAHNGLILLDHYDTASTSKLIDHCFDTGDQGQYIYGLGKNVRKTRFHDVMDYHVGSLVQPHVHKNLKRFEMSGLPDYAYYLDGNGVWHYLSPDSAGNSDWLELTDEEIEAE